ncbi:hypothetical protein [Kitasatospora sp. NPDC050543]|uniref:hypothetical protein n=1 Tax=Kitasatospora sp. NPDC050543 TaxID=3364054 RepID=UPI0037A89834
MITYEDRRLRTLADEGRWPELLGIYRRARVAAAALAGEDRAAAQTAPLGHLIAHGAPPEVAVRLFDEDGGAGSAAGVGDHDAGPLWEVLATRHSWRRLAPLLGPPAVRRLVAHTRVLLGEDLSYGAEPDPEGVPLVLEPWEMAGWGEGGRVRDYLRSGGSRSSLLTLPADREGLGPVELPVRRERLPGQRATAEFAALADWAQAACVRGGALDAAAQFAPGSRVTGGYVPFAVVYPVLVQTGAGARPHGAARGRLAVWRGLAAMAGAGRPERAEVNALIARLRCFTWCDPADELRYLHAALEDPATGLSWAVSGADFEG